MDDSYMPGSLPFPRMNILGINISCLSYAEMYPVFDQWLNDKYLRSHSVAVINVHICVSALLKKNLRDLYNSADLVSIDSMPFLKWARLFYYKNSDRFYAPDLLLEISDKVQEKGYSFYLYGGYPGAPEKIAEFLKRKFSTINIAGVYSPPFRPLTETEDFELCEKINRAKPDFLWVGLGSPKQDVWIRDHLEKIKGCIMIPSGATFDFFSGKIRQAPKWVRNLGFEWLFRLSQDFTRLWIRYTVYNLIFIVMFTLQLLRIISFDKDNFLTILGFRTKFWNS